MLTDISGVPAPAATRNHEAGTPFTPDRGWHRTSIHTRPQHGCDRCPPTPCVCGHTDGTCPQAFEHRRAHAGSETTWRETAR
jgi:hypothetical protein